MRIVNRDSWKLVGNFTVDSGLCYIRDPCYILHTEKDPPKSIGNNWSDFCNNLGDDYPTKKSFGFNMGHEGLGMCLSTGWGDGFYPVYARVKGGRILQIFIDFDGEIENENIYEENIDRDED